MARYFTTRASKAFHVSDDTWIMPMLPTLHVPDHEATDTGLLDANGDPIWRAPREMGFGRDID